MIFGLPPVPVAAATLVGLRTAPATRPVEALNQVIAIPMRIVLVIDQYRAHMKQEGGATCVDVRRRTFPHSSLFA
jgi:hypothetical protein